MTDRSRQLHLLPRNAREVLPLDDHGLVTQSMPCLECGYIVRGMKIAQSCPECGTPIARSLRGLLLRFADLTWLGMVRAGMTLVAAFIVLNALMPPDLVGSLFDDDPVIAPVMWFVMAFITGMFVVGQWMLTTPEPTGILSRSEDRLRMAIRTLTVLAGGLLLMHDAIVTRTDPSIEAPLVAATALAMLGVVVTTGLFVRGIADRIPDAELRTAATVTAIGLAISLGGYAATVIWMAGRRVSIGELRTTNIITLIVEPYGDSAVGAIMWLIAIIAAVATLGAVAVTLGFRSAIREVFERVDYAGGTSEQAMADAGESSCDHAEDEAAEQPEDRSD